MRDRCHSVPILSWCYAENLMGKNTSDILALRLFVGTRCIERLEC